MLKYPRCCGVRILIVARRARINEICCEISAIIDDKLDHINYEYISFRSKITPDVVLCVGSASGIRCGTNNGSSRRNAISVFPNKFILDWMRRHKHLFSIEISNTFDEWGSRKVHVAVAWRFRSSNKTVQTTRRVRINKCRTQQITSCLIDFSEYLKCKLFHGSWTGIDGGPFRFSCFRSLYLPFKLRLLHCYRRKHGRLFICTFTRFGALSLCA